MKDKIFFLSFLLLLCFGSMSVSANYIPVEPNKYEEKKIKLQTDYIHEKSLLNRRTKIPEAQKMLTFEPKKRPSNEKIKGTLFVSHQMENNTITAKAEELALFSDVEKRYSYVAESDQNLYKESSIWLSIFYGLAAMISAGLLFFVLVPKLNQSSDTDY